jgi:6-phosphogluconolactonase/HAD-superfamily hydrolase, subfamily IIB
MSRDPKQISLLLADVDGTLVTHEKVLTDKARAAIAKLKEAGVKFAITSGRPPKGMEMVIKPLAIETPIAGFNGGLFTKPDLTPVEERNVPGDVARAVIEMIVAEGLDAWLYAGNDWLIHKEGAPHVAREQKTVQFAPKVVDDFGDKIDNAVKIVGVSDDHDLIKRCVEHVHKTFGAKVTAALSQPYYLDVTHPAANKGAVVEALSKRLDIPTAEIATIGDSSNDVSMFEKGGFAIAMGNADDEVKGSADVVVADCDSEGLRRGRREFHPPARERPLMTKPQRSEIRPDPASLAECLADFIARRFEETTGRFALNLSGGSTPKLLYELLATEVYRRKFDWERVHLFFGDERFVPMDDTDSNYRMVREALISRVPIPSENVHPVQTEDGTPADAAAAYESKLKAYYGKETLDLARPLFQITLLGLGEDGHTASLFPGTDALSERRKWVTSVVGAKPEPRITMTYPVIASSDIVVLLVAGAGKRDILERVLDGDKSLPAAHVDPQHAFYVFCDDAAKGDA